MSGLFGNRDSEIKDRGFVIYSNDEYFEAYLNYLKNTGGYQFIRFVNVSGSQYIAFSQRGFDNIKSFLMQKLQTKREEADRLEAEINEAFSAAEPTEIPKDEKSELSEIIEWNPKGSRMNLGATSCRTWTRRFSTLTCLKNGR